MQQITQSESQHQVWSIVNRPHFQDLIHTQDELAKKAIARENGKQCTCQLDGLFGFGQSCLVHHAWVSIMGTISICQQCGCRIIVHTTWTCQHHTTWSEHRSGNGHDCTSEQHDQCRYNVCSLSTSGSPTHSAWSRIRKW